MCSDVRSGIAGFADDLTQQKSYFRDRAPAYRTILDHVSNELGGGLGERLARAWQDRSFLVFYDRPLLLLASLRFDALCEGPTHPLWPSIGERPSASEPTAAELEAALGSERTRFWDSLARRSVQTNETTRAVAWLWPAHQIAKAAAHRPLYVVDVGTSAGLNLIADQLAMDWVDGDGKLLELLPLPPIASRLGFDLSPLRVEADDAVLWLRACVWPSDTDRLARLEQAIAAFRTALALGSPAPRLETCAIQDVPARVAGIAPDQTLLVFQTIMRDYVPSEAFEDYKRGLYALLAERPPGSMLWAELEIDAQGDSLDRIAALSAHVADRERRVQTLVLARTQPHPRRLFVDPAAVSELKSALGAL